MVHIESYNWHWYEVQFITVNIRCYELELESTRVEALLADIRQKNDTDMNEAKRNEKLLREKCDSQEEELRVLRVVSAEATSAVKEQAMRGNFLRQSLTDDLEKSIHRVEELEVENKSLWESALQQDSMLKDSYGASADLSHQLIEAEKARSITVTNRGGAGGDSEGRPHLTFEEHEEIVQTMLSEADEKWYQEKLDLESRLHQALRQVMRTIRDAACINTMCNISMVPSLIANCL